MEKYIPKFVKSYLIFYLLFIFNISFSQNTDKINDSLFNHSYPLNFDGDYAIKGKDSIKIINKTMRYMLSFCINKLNFEKNTFIQYREYSFRQIYDSLSQLYLKFDFFRVNNYAHDGFVDSGLIVSFYYLVDSNTIYNLDLFLVDTYLVKNRWDLTRKQMLEKVLKLKKYGILAYKSNENIIDWSNRISDEDEKKEFLKNKQYREYLRLLKKLSKK